MPPAGTADPNRARSPRPPLQIIDDMLGTLPETQQEILRLRVVVGLSAEETADALGMTAGAVRVSQHRDLVKLRNMLASDTSLSEQLV